MIRNSCAWARVSSRRNATSPPHQLFPRNTNSTSGTHFPTSPSHVVRRHNASKPPIGQKAPDSTKTIPGPSWLWLEPIYEPFRAYGRVQQRKPYMTQFLSSLVIYFVGDLVAQSIVSPEKEAGAPAGEEKAEERGWVQQWSEDRDWHRTGRAIIIGGLSSIPSYKWFLWLGNNFNYSSKILSLTTKVVVNQALFTPLFNSYFFGMQTLLTGATLPEIIERIKNTVPTSWINSCKLWPIVTAFSFTYIPIQYRSIFGGVIAIGWQTYLSLLNQRAAAMESVEYEAEHKVSAPVRVVQRREEREQDKQKCAV